VQKGSRKSPGAQNHATGTSTAGVSKKTSKSYAKKLSKNRKLKLEEWEWCMKAGLCMFCGGARHVAKDCKKKDCDGRVDSRVIHEVCLNISALSPNAFYIDLSASVLQSDSNISNIESYLTKLHSVVS
jgi:hypothetical protein